MLGLEISFIINLCIICKINLNLSYVTLLFFDDYFPFLDLRPVSWISLQQDLDSSHIHDAPGGCTGGKVCSLSLTPSLPVLTSFQLSSISLKSLLLYFIVSVIIIIIII